MTYILLDIGGTKTRVASSKNLKKLDKISKFTTAPKFKSGIENIIKAIEEMQIPDKIDGIAIGIRGRLNEAKTELDNDGVLTLLKSNLKRPCLWKMILPWQDWGRQYTEQGKGQI
jgi:predicted NBD/HSP70 family sugar kinase